MSSAFSIIAQKRNLGLFSIALVFFCATLLVSAPATLLIPAIKRTAPDLAYTNIEGTIWNAQLRHVTVENIAVENVKLVFDFSSLLQGGLAYTILVNEDAFRGSLIAKRNLSGRIELNANSVEVGQSVISRMALLGVRLDGIVTFSNAQVILNDRKCTHSSGYVETNFLRAPARQFNVSAPDLSGNVVCKDGKLGLELAGSEQSFGDVSIGLMSHPPRHMIFKAVLSLNDKTLEDTLKFSGFEKNGNTIQFEQIVGL